MPEINDLKAGIKSISALGDFSTIEFTLVGLGEPRVVRAGVVSGSFFPVMGLQPIRGRLVDATDDGPQAASVTVLTHRFWTESLNSDENILGKQIKLGDRASTIIGVLEPSVPYPDGNAADRQRRHQLASHVGDDAGRPRASHDGIVRAA